MTTGGRWSGPTLDHDIDLVRPGFVEVIGPGMASGAMLVFATSFGEFALVQITAGARFETVSLYGFDLLVRTGADFGALAVLTAVPFLVVAVVAAAAVRGGGMDARSGAAGATTR